MVLNNKYEFDSKTDLLGVGGFARVYKARNIHLKIDVAIKLFEQKEKEHFSYAEEFRKGLLLSHPNLVRYFDFDTLETEHSIRGKEIQEFGVMEFIPGGTIEQYLKKHGQQHLKDLLTQILHGLAYLHDEGIIHRDIDPMNILIDNRKAKPIAKITDFGISREVEKTAVSSVLAGKPNYLAPEQFKGLKPTPAVDYWAFGVMVYYLLTGEKPFEIPGGNEAINSAHAIQDRISNATIPQKIHSLPEPYKTSVLLCLEKDPAVRLENSNKILEILERNFSQEFIISSETLPKTLWRSENSGEKPTRSKIQNKKETNQELRNLNQISFHELIDRFDYYYSEDLLGSGGFSKVVRAIDSRYNIPVVLKFYFDPNIEVGCLDPDPINLNEKYTLAPFEVLEVLYQERYGISYKTKIAVLRYMDGGNLSQFMTHDTNYQYLESLLTDVLIGLQNLHLSGIHHGNIHEKNILVQWLGSTPRALVVDYGLDIKPYLQNSFSPEKHSKICRSPEQLEYGINDFRSDIWAFGALVYNMFTNRSFKEDLVKEFYDKNSLKDLNYYSHPFFNKIPEPFKEIAIKCLNKDPNSRYQSASEVYYKYFQ